MWPTGPPQAQLTIFDTVTKSMPESHAICHKIESTHCNKVTINATFTSLIDVIHAIP